MVRAARKVKKRGSLGIADEVATEEEPSVCAPWCHGDEHARIPWVKKCTWQKCHGCDECPTEIYYWFGLYPSNSCPAGSARIIEADRCEVAAKELGATFLGNFSSDSLPKGCITWRHNACSSYRPPVHEERFSLNTHSTGSGEPSCKQTHLVCESAQAPCHPEECYFFQNTSWAERCKRKHTCSGCGECQGGQAEEHTHE